MIEGVKEITVQAWDILCAGKGKEGSVILLSLESYHGKAYFTRYQYKDFITV